MNRQTEQFREDLRKSITFDDMRLMNVNSLSRCADEDAVNKMRLSLYGQQSKKIAKMTQRSEDYYEMEKARATKGDYKMDVREFALEDDVAVMYFNWFGHNFEGGEIVDDAGKPWECPGCHLKYGMSLKALPDHCMRCGWTTPLGELKADGAFDR